MSKLTFKQFNDFVEAPLDEEQIDEVFGIFKNKEQKEKAERKRLELLASKGNESAKMQLRKLEKDDEVRGATKKSISTLKDRTFSAAKADVEAGERGSSRAYDTETGSAGRKFEPRWNGSKREWEKYDPVRKTWTGTGDRDAFSGEPDKRGNR